jgi:hypothetical protein
MIDDPATLEALVRVGRLITRPPPSHDPPTGPTIYLCDLKSGDLTSCHLKTGAFTHLAAQPIITALRFEASYGALCAVMDEVRDRKLTQIGRIRDLQTGLAAFYALRASPPGFGRFSDVLQHIIIRYPPEVAGPYYLRPVLVPSATPLSREQIKAHVWRAVRTDQQKFPGRFPEAAVSRFAVCKPRIVRPIVVAALPLSVPDDPDPHLC